LDRKGGIEKKESLHDAADEQEDLSSDAEISATKTSIHVVVV